MIACRVHFRGRLVKVLGAQRILKRLERDYAFQADIESALAELTGKNGSVPEVVSVSEDIISAEELGL